MTVRTLLFPVLLGAVVVTAACATMTVSSHVDPNLDAKRYRTFDWGPADALPTPDPRLDKNPFYQDKVQGAIEKEFAAKGFARADAGGQADLLIHFHAVIDRHIDINRIDADHGYCFDANCQARVVEYEAGTLVLDVVDAKTNRVIWRGWAQNTIDDAKIDNEQRLARQVDEAVRRMLARFPGAL
jgi:hypothetical protein